MSKSSEAVKKWRKATKQRMVDAMGGKCQCCGYNRCIESLDFHHLDPSKKDLGFGALRASPRSWLIIVQELRKCVLVCRNCHGEIHFGNLQVPVNYARFDESYVNYKRLIVPNANTPDYGKRIDWSQIDLPTQLKAKSCAVLADELGVTTAAVYYQKKKQGI